MSCQIRSIRLKKYCILWLWKLREFMHPNDYILYQNKYSNLKKYPKCKASRYKQKNDQIMENEDDDIEDRKRPTVKVLWYLPIVSRFQRLFF
jgi:hypothetical protein